MLTLVKRETVSGHFRGYLTLRLCTLLSKLRFEDDFPFYIVIDSGASVPPPMHQP